MSCKSIIEDSVFLFLVPTKDSRVDFAIVVVDLSNERFVVYDPERNAEQKNYSRDI